MAAAAEKPGATVAPALDAPSAPATVTTTTADRPAAGRRPYEPCEELSAERLVRARPKRAGLAVRAPRVAADRGSDDKLRAIRTPLHTCHRITMAALKGGVGKTSITVGLGSTLAKLRNDRVAAIDANPDAGTLGRRVPPDTNAGIRELLLRLPKLRTYMDIRPYTRRTAEGLEVLANGRDPDVSKLLDAQEYRAVMDLLCGSYPIVLTDSGTGLFTGALQGVLDHTDQLVLCTTPGVDAAHSAVQSLDWLAANGRRALAEQAVVVISGLRDAARLVKVEQMVEYFESRCRAVCLIPYDEQLAVGDELRLDRLRSRTRAAFVDLAAVVGEGMSGAGSRGR